MARSSVGRWCPALLCKLTVQMTSLVLASAICTPGSGRWLGGAPDRRGAGAGLAACSWTTMSLATRGWHMAEPTYLGSGSPDLQGKLCDCQPADCSVGSGPCVVVNGRRVGANSHTCVPRCGWTRVCQPALTSGLCLLGSCTRWLHVHSQVTTQLLRSPGAAAQPGYRRCLSRCHCWPDSTP